jgi:meso-butanediol dehydrogenase/(S,S)-butanediol dehydrogenase/diacetyl reductase
LSEAFDATGAQREGSKGDLRGRVVVVTGASRGIGLATSQALIECNARVALLARGAEELADAASALASRSEALPVAVDVSDPESVREAFGQLARHFGAVHALVNNAAVGCIDRIEDASDDDLAAQVGINLLGPILCARAAIPHLRAAGGGDIVNLSSDSVERPFPFLGVYAATKGGVETLTLALRSELAADGIRVALLRSGPALTSFARDWHPEAAGRALAAWQAGGYMDPARVVAPDVVGRAVVQLLTQPPEASVHTLDLRPR